MSFMAEMPYWISTWWLRSSWLDTGTTLPHETAVLFLGVQRYLPQNSDGILMAQMVKKPPTMQETWVRSQGWEDPLEKGMTTHSSILAQRIPWIEKPGRLQSTGSQRVGHDWATTHSTPRIVNVIQNYKIVVQWHPE